MALFDLHLVTNVKRARDGEREGGREKKGRKGWRKVGRERKEEEKFKRLSTSMKIIP